MAQNAFKGFIVVCLLVWLLGDNAAQREVVRQQYEAEVPTVSDEDDEEGAEPPPVMLPKWCDIMPINIGNFSSHIFSYVTTALLAETYGKTACVSANKHNYMSWLFDSLPLKTVTLEEYQAIYDDISFKVQLGSKDVLGFPVADADLIILETVPIAVNLIESHRTQTVEMLKFADRYQNFVKAFFDPLVKKYGSDATFVGAHIRVTRDGGSVIEPGLIQKLMKEAMKWIIATSTSAGRLVFILSTDDDVWVKANLNFLSTMNVELTADHRDLLKGSDPLYFDFAILSSCQHSVGNNHGAMFFWTSFIAGGDVYMPFVIPGGSGVKSDMILQIERANLERYHNVDLSA